MMKRLSLTAIVLAALLGQIELVGQSLGDHFKHYEVGLSFERILLVEYDSFDGEWIPGRSTELSITTASFGVGVNLPFVEVSEGATIGINGRLAVLAGPPHTGSSITSEGQDGLSILGVHVPIMASFKYGADATFRAVTPFGVGLGVGYQPALLLLGEGLAYATIVGMGEVAYATRKVCWKLRGQMSLVDEKLEENVTAGGMTLSLIMIPRF